MDSLRSQCSGFPNKDQQASVGFRDPIEAQAVENSWFVLYCPGGGGVQEVASSDFGAWFRLPWSVPVLHGHGKLQMKGA